jgi:hypothetical protein
MWVKRLPGLFVVLALAVNARADVIYTFTYTATSGPFQSTTFQLDEPNFLTAGTYFPSPFPLSDGSALYPVTVLQVDPFGNNVCFIFGANANSLAGCGGNISASTVPVGFLSLEFPGSSNPPSTAETLSGGGQAAGIPNLTSQVEDGFGNVTLVTDQVPEPATAPLVGVLLLAGAVILTRKQS